MKSFRTSNSNYVDQVGADGGIYKQFNERLAFLIDEFYSLPREMFPCLSPSSYISCNSISNLKFAIAVSGGADSVCLALLMKQFVGLFPGRGVTLSCIIIDHGLRSESTQEAETVKATLIKHGFQVALLKIEWSDGAIPLTNVMKIARDKRYSLLVNYCKANRIDILLTGHNKDDQAETVLMRILRGSGVDGIAGIPEISWRQDICIMRPLLRISRAEIEQIVTSSDYGLWVSDRTNSHEKYDRVRIRNLIRNKDCLFGMRPERLIGRLTSVSSNAQRASSCLRKCAREQFLRLCFPSQCGTGLFLPALSFAKLHEEIGLRVLTYAIYASSGVERALRFASLKRLYERLVSPKQVFGWICTIGGCEIKFIRGERENLVFFVREYKCISDELLSLQPGEWSVWDGRFRVMIDKEDFAVTRLRREWWPLIKPRLHRLSSIEVSKWNERYVIYGNDLISVDSLDVRVSIKDKMYELFSNEMCEKTQKVQLQGIYKAIFIQPIFLKKEIV